MEMTLDASFLSLNTNFVPSKVLSEAAGQYRMNPDINADRESPKTM